MSTKRFKHYFSFPDKEARQTKLVQITYRPLDDGLDTTVRHVHKGDVVQFEAKMYHCALVFHNYDDAAIEYVMKPIEDE